MSTEERLEVIEKKLDMLLSLKAVPDEWVGATVITKKTGWDKHDLERARRNGSIKYKIKSEGSKRTYKYLLSSVIK